MQLKINSKEIKEKATKPERMKVNFFLDKKVYLEFKSNCDDATMAMVLEELMKAFNEDFKKKGRKR